MKKLPHIQLLQFCFANPIFHGDAERHRHAIRAHDAYERAVIFLRMMLAETTWDDGRERMVDDCFEMNDGDAVVGWLMEFCDADPRIRALLAAHPFMQAGKGRTMLDIWAENPAKRSAHRQNELTLLPT